MSAVLDRLGREPKAGRLDGEIPSSRPATVTTRDERLRLYGHLSCDEKARLRVLVDAAARKKEGLTRSGRQRCVATNWANKPCQNMARPGDDLCALHLRMAVA